MINKTINHRLISIKQTSNGKTAYHGLIVNINTLGQVERSLKRFVYEICTEK